MINFNNMMDGPSLRHAFATPIYTCNLNADTLKNVQEELEPIYEDLLAKNKFQHNRNSHSHMISDITFTENLLDNYNTENFKKELNLHLKHYLSLIRANIEIKNGSEYTITSSWMTLNKQNSYAVVHSHGSSDLSGVYYFKTNGKDGNLFFETPIKMNKANYCFRHYATTEEIAPKVGNIILFPGWMEHGVGTNQTDNDRVSLSFNIDFKR
jgi:uncharacterized protein (TIGR02466 family)